MSDNGELTIHVTSKYEGCWETNTLEKAIAEVISTYEGMINTFHTRQEMVRELNEKLQPYGYDISYDPDEEVNKAGQFMVEVQFPRAIEEGKIKLGDFDGI